jgi:hypothetical protein
METHHWAVMYTLHTGNQLLLTHTVIVIHFVSIGAKFGICTVVGLNGTLVEAEIRTWDTKSKRGCMEQITEYIFYCKRAILFLSSSKILTPHPPLRPASVLRGEDRLAGWRGGWGVNILEDERNRIALLQ